MGLVSQVRDRLKARKRRRVREDIFEALDVARRDAVTRPISPDDRLVIFSDHHKGARDGADDFQRCERAYNAALAYYDHLGYDLIELGDVEEPWENCLTRSPRATRRRYVWPPRSKTTAATRACSATTTWRGHGGQRPSREP